MLLPTEYHVPLPAMEGQKYKVFSRNGKKCTTQPTQIFVHSDTTPSYKHHTPKKQRSHVQEKNHLYMETRHKTIQDSTKK